MLAIFKRCNCRRHRRDFIFLPRDLAIRLAVAVLANGVFRAKGQELFLRVLELYTQAS